MGNLLPPAFPRVGYLAILINTCSSVFQSYFKLTKLTLLGGGDFLLSRLNSSSSKLVMQFAQARVSWRPNQTQVEHKLMRPRLYAKNYEQDSVPTEAVPLHNVTV